MWAYIFFHALLHTVLSMRILIVVPLALRGFIRSGLEDEGFTVDVAVDAEAVRTLTGMHRYDLMVLDPTTGAPYDRVVRHLRPEHCPPILLLMGANADNAEKLCSCAVVSVPVPFRFADLLTAIRGSSLSSSG